MAGHAIEFRINAEDPSRGFAPAPGVITRFDPPTGEGVRVDTHVTSGYEVPPHYDSLIAKLIVHGRDRRETISRSIAALDAFAVEGVPTTIPMHLSILRSDEFVNDQHDTGGIPGWPAEGAH